jgi:hypothetical protein
MNLCLFGQYEYGNIEDAAVTYIQVAMWYFLVNFQKHRENT